jgi:hypothetical protein
MSEHNQNDSSPPSASQHDESEAFELDVSEMTLPIEAHWICIACHHYEIQNPIICGSCHRYKSNLFMSQAPVIKAPVSKASLHQEEQSESEDQQLLDVAFSRLQDLVSRAQKEGRSLDDADRAKLYENLLISLLKIEREKARKAAFLDIFQEEREEKKRNHMLHLSIIWFLGICTGFALYFALEAVK